MPDTAAGQAELGTGWPKWLFRAQALVLGLAVGQILAAHGV